MFRIDSVTKEIQVTRGDIGELNVTAKNQDNTDYTFVVGDVVRIKVFKSKDCGCIVLDKSVTVAEETESVEIDLTGEDTTIGDLINKPVEYWYEIELNPDTNPQTIIGYEKETGAKIFTLLPEGDNSNE